MRETVTDAALSELFSELISDNMGNYEINGNNTVNNVLKEQGHVTVKQLLDSANFSGDDPKLQILADAATFNEQDQEERRIKKEQFANLQIRDVDSRNGAVVTFDSATNTYTIAFCGTRRTYGEWEDNGIAMYSESSPMQEQAAQYYDYWASKIPKDANIVVTGHSKGGNKAQYVTMFAKNRDRITQCISLDGQGFSNEAMDAMQKHDDFAEQRDKITLVCGENDYVHVLGNRLAQRDQTYYLYGSHRLSTEGVSAIPKDHCVEEMFGNTGKQYYSLLDMEANQGPVSTFVEALSEKIMELPPEQRKICVTNIMRLFQDDVDIGVLLETLPDVIGYLGDDVVQELFSSPEGQALLQYLPVTIFENEQMQGVSGTIVLGFMWFLTIDSSSTTFQIFDAALHTLGLSMPTFHGLLTKIITVATTLHTGWDYVRNTWDNLKEWAYVTFGIGSSGRRETAVSLASAHEYIEVDTDTYHTCAQQLKNISENLDNIKIRIDKIYYDAHSKKSILEATGEGIMEVLNLNFIQFPKAKECVDNAANGAKLLAQALTSMAEILEEAEMAAVKYANLIADKEN